MLKNAEKLQLFAGQLDKAAKDIQGEAVEVVTHLKGFRDWTAKAVANATEVHEAVKAKLDEDHAALTQRLGEMASQLDDIIGKLEGAANG